VFSRWTNPVGERGTGVIYFSHEAETRLSSTASQIFQNKEWKIEFGANLNQEESVADAEKRCLAVLRGWLRQKPYRVQQFEEMMPDFGWIWEELVVIYGKPEVARMA
jgi:hypothetical protein